MVKVMNTIFVLDKNIIALIYEQLTLVHKPKDSSKRLTKKQLEMLKFLKRHDRKQYAFSSVTSVIEGRTRQKESFEQVKVSIEYDTKNLDSFFSNARTDTKSLKSDGANTAHILSHFNPVYSERKYREVLKHYYLSLEKYRVKGSIPKDKIDEFSFSILNFSDNLGLPLNNPIIKIILMYINQIKIYREPNSKRKEPIDILHPSKKIKDLDERVHNVYSDLSIPNLLASQNYAKNKIFQLQKVKIRFLTLDEALKEYVNLFDLKIKSKKISKNQPGVEDMIVELYVNNSKVDESLNEVYKKWKDSNLEK
ncbi:hypothetical protein BJI46_03965 [Acinetobacter qingfengensis]|uniref:Uncharacterized protein n=2 Tax=Acinetobacter qingfengensis TaxID=1262585 RepID=A0A1E7R2Q6_9GAMM|nr:hypothetical protein BJI46_03965 [Acinetobacter qingfengensis]